MALSVCCDASVFEKGKQLSYTPITVEILNLPPRVRQNEAAQFVMGVMPPKVGSAANYKVLMSKIPKLIKLYPPGSAGFPVHDAVSDDIVNITFEIVKLLEDGCGMQYVVGCHGNTAKIGACPFCKQVGYTWPGVKSSRFPTFVMQLPVTDLVGRDMFHDIVTTAAAVREPIAVPFADLWLLSAPPERTSAEARACVAAVESKECTPETVPFYNAGPFNYLPNFLKLLVNDPAHIVKNFVCDLLCLVLNEPGPFAYGPESRAKEAARSRTFPRVEAHRSSSMACNERLYSFSSIICQNAPNTSRCCQCSDIFHSSILDENIV